MEYKKINLILILSLFIMSMFDGIITWIYSFNEYFVEYNPFMNYIFLNYGSNIFLLVKVIITISTCSMLTYISITDIKNHIKINTIILFGCIIYGLLTCYWIINLLYYCGVL